MLVQAARTPPDARDEPNIDGTSSTDPTNHKGWTKHWWYKQHRPHRSPLASGGVRAALYHQCLVHPLCLVGSVLLVPSMFGSPLVIGGVRAACTINVWFTPCVWWGLCCLYHQCLVHPLWLVGKKAAKATSTKHQTKNMTSTDPTKHKGWTKHWWYKQHRPHQTQGANQTLMVQAARRSYF
jgi:hypothetical protein